MSRQIIGLLATAAVAALTGVPAQATIAVSSEFRIGVYADADTTDSTFQKDTFSDSQLGTLNPYSHSLSVTDSVTYPVNGQTGTATTTSAAAADWTSADAGEVTMTDMGWSVATLAASEVMLNGDAGAGPIWSYTFTATADGSFDMTYDVSASGDPFGLQGMIIDWSGPGGGLDLTNAYDPTASGTFSRSLTNGVTYTIDIANYGNVGSSGGFTTSGSMDGDFKWQISGASVPGPAALLPFAGGLFFALRRRRR